MPCGDISHIDIMENKFKKVHTAKDLIVSFALIIIGVAVIFIDVAPGLLIALCGTLSLIFYKSGHKIAGQDIVFQKKSLDICKKCRASVLDFLNGKDVDPEIKEGSDGGSVRIDVYYNQSESVAFALLYDFVNYAYEPATALVEHRGNRADKLISQL